MEKSLKSEAGQGGSYLDELNEVFMIPKESLMFVAPEDTIQLSLAHYSI